mmetsp:Transcript_13823/g.24184  ORF Transcript_13823/g.24184 Transcript_13823/m.24184 type:complete len:171 (+) Transcript_13823:85-597(+)
MVLGSIIQVLGGFALGFWARGLAEKKGRKANSSEGIKKTLPKKSAAIVPRPKEELKMVLCVNEGLKMGKGKIGAQCAHAAVGACQRHRAGKNEALFKHWEWFGATKIALRLQDSDEMDKLETAAATAGLFTYIVCDAGRTQIPAGSQTVLAIGPGPKSAVDKVCGHLKLL